MDVLKPNKSNANDDDGDDEAPMYFQSLDGDDAHSGYDSDEREHPNVAYHHFIRAVHKNKRAQKIVMAVVASLVVCALIALSYVLFTTALSGNANAKRNVERELGVSLHYMKDYVVEPDGDHKCSRPHPFSTRKRASLCVPFDADVHTVADGVLRWMPPSHLFFRDAASYTLPGAYEESNVHMWRTSLYASGFSYCLPPRSERVRMARSDTDNGPCPPMVQCRYDGAPLQWGMSADVDRFRCSPMVRDEDYHSVLQPPDARFTIDNVHIVCKDAINDMHYGAPTVHSDFSDCTLSYERSDRTRERLLLPDTK